MERASGECASLFLPIQLALIVCKSGIILLHFRLSRYNCGVSVNAKIYGHFSPKSKILIERKFTISLVMDYNDY